MADVNQLNSEEVSPGGSEEPSTTGYQGRFVAPTPDQLSRLIPQVEVLQLLGQGGMGAVYKARQTKLDRLVALKVLPSEAGRDPAFATRFAREARALARLNDPHIVAIHDFGDSEGLYYFLMEFVDGVNLRQMLKSGALRPADVWPLVLQICDALQYAHDEGIVHRDIKPENILVDRRGRVKIADFGLAKLLGQTTADRGLTASQQVMGTWHYMAPEQIEHPLQVDHRADIYSLGVLFYEMLTGGLPLGHFALPSQRAAVDARTDVVILRALAKEPEKRYQRVHEMKAALLALNQGFPLSPPPVRGAPAAEGAGFQAATTPLGSPTPGNSAVQADEATYVAPRRHFLASTTGWALICCFVVILPALPAIGSNRYPGIPPATFTTMGALYGVLVLLLVATSFIEPVPLWRPFVVITAGADVMMLTLAYFSHYGWRIDSDVDVWVGMCLAIGTVLTLLGTFQLRGVLMRLYRSSPASPDTTTPDQNRR